MLVTTNLLGPAIPHACPICGAPAQTCGSKGHNRQMIRETRTAAGKLVAGTHIWVPAGNGVQQLLYAPGQIVKPEDEALVEEAMDKAAPKAPEKPKDKALRGPRDKPKE